MTKYAIALAAGTALYACAPACAQEAAPETATTAPTPAPEIGTAAAPAAAGVLVYGPDFFASSRPNTALDMIMRLPGFALDIGNGDARGLSGSAGNVLIDGDRPASKSDRLDEVLRRIAAASVERVELIRGGAPGIDMQGRSVVANVVLKRAAKTEYVIETNAYGYPDGFIAPLIKGQYSRREGDNQTEVAVSGTTDRTGGTAQGSRRRYDASGALYQTADLDLWDRYRNLNLRGSVQRRVGGGKLRVNGLVDYTSFENRQIIDILSGSGIDSRNQDVNRNPSGELGFNWTRPLGTRTELELTGLQRLNRNNYKAKSFDGTGDTSTFGIDSTAGESIARGILKYRQSDRWAFEGGGEIAYNFLDSKTDYAQNGVVVPLPNASVRVSELRGEGFAQTTWRPNARLTLEAGLRVEVSRIAQSGDTDLSRSFVYPKPRVQLTWIPGKDQQIRLRAEKQVGQLDFGDFVASTEVNLGTVAGGNAELEPQKETVLEAVYERRFWNKGVFELTVQHRLVSDIIDIIPLVGGIDAVGNIGSGYRGYVQARVTLPLDKLGLKNALLSARAAEYWSQATDPLTHEKRRLSNEGAFGCGISYSQDLKGGRFSYGFEHGCNVDRALSYRVREVRGLEAPPFISIYGQWKPSSSLTLRVDLGNASDSRRINTREVHAGPRNTTPLLFREERELRQGRYVFLQIRKTL